MRQPAVSGGLVQCWTTVLPVAAARRPRNWEIIPTATSIAPTAQLLSQCLECIYSLLPRLWSTVAVIVVLCIQRLRQHLLRQRLLSAAGAMTSSAVASSNAMKVRKPEPAEIEYKNMKFLITYRPTDATMDRFIEVCCVFCGSSFVKQLSEAVAV